MPNVLIPPDPRRGPDRTRDHQTIRPAIASPENSTTAVKDSKHPMGTTMQHPPPWLLPLPQRINRVLLYGPSLASPGHQEHEEVHQDGKSHAQNHAYKDPEQTSPGNPYHRDPPLI